MERNGAEWRCVGTTGREGYIVEASGAHALARKNARVCPRRGHGVRARVCERVCVW